MTPSDKLERNLAIGFIKSNIASNLDGLKKAAAEILRRLG